MRMYACSCLSGCIVPKHVRSRRVLFACARVSGGEAACACGEEAPSGGCARACWLVQVQLRTRSAACACVARRRGGAACRTNMPLPPPCPIAWPFLSLTPVFAHSLCSRLIRCCSPSLRSPLLFLPFRLAITRELLCLWRNVAVCVCCARLVCARCVLACGRMGTRR